MTQHPRLPIDIDLEFEGHPVLIGFPLARSPSSFRTTFLSMVTMISFPRTEQTMFAGLPGGRRGLGRGGWGRGAGEIRDVGKGREGRVRFRHTPGISRSRAATGLRTSTKR